MSSDLKEFNLDKNNEWALKRSKQTAFFVKINIPMMTSMWNEDFEADNHGECNDNVHVMLCNVIRNVTKPDGTSLRESSVLAKNQLNESKPCCLIWVQSGMEYQIEQWSML